VSGSYGKLLDYVVFGDWIFFGLTAATLFVYRARDKSATSYQLPATSFRVPFYPLTPILFCAAAGYVVAGSIQSNPGNALVGTALIVGGIPIYVFWRAKAQLKVES